MLWAGVQADTVTRSIVIKARVGAGNVPKAEHWLSPMWKAGGEAVIKACSGGGDVARAKIGL